MLAKLVSSNALLAGLTGSKEKGEDLSAVLRDPSVLQTLISALQQQRREQERHPDALGVLERQEAANARNLADAAQVTDTGGGGGGGAGGGGGGGGADSRTAGAAAAHLASLSREDRMKFNFRTEMCGNFLKSGHCRYGTKCMFAHTREELQLRTTNASQASLRTPLTSV